MTSSADLKSNPLVHPPKLPYDALPLDTVKIEHFLPAIERGIALSQAEVNAIKDNPAAPTFENTIEALEFAGKDLHRAITVYNIFSGTKSTKAMRGDPANGVVGLDEIVGQKLSEHSNNISLDDVLFARIKAVHDDPASQNLGSDQKRLLEVTYDGYVRQGVLLPPEQKQRLREIDEAMSALTNKFSANLAGAKEAVKIEVPVADLDGVPADIVNRVTAKANAAGLSGKAIIVLNDDAGMISKYSRSRSLREAIHRAQTTLAYADPQFDNRPVIMDLVKLRHERAQLFGYKNHAESVLANRMSKNPETVMAFLNDNLKAYKPSAETYLQQVRDFAAKKDGLADLKPWDLAFYNNQLVEELFQIDTQKVREYFTLENGIKAFQQHIKKAFGLTLKEKPYPVHKDTVRIYEVFNNASKSKKSFVGLFVTNYTQDQNSDSFKQGGAWMDAPRTRSVQNGVVTYPIITNDCNYSRQEPDEPPVLLSQDDYTTIFHEGGHGLHGLLYKGDYPTLSGPNVLWDFVETQSQLQENWIGERALLKKYARHYLTNKPIPDDMLDKLEAKRNFGSGFAGLRQTRLALLDMKWHMTDPAQIQSVDALEQEISDIASLMPSEGGATSTSFSHIFAGGYSAGYNSYKWAEVLEAHIYSLFPKDDIYNKDIMAAVQERIYASGNRRHPSEEFRELAGCDPDPKFLYEREGILPVALAPAP